MGALVSKTISKGVIEPEQYAAEPKLFAVCMVCVSFAAAATTFLATWKGYPVSSRCDRPVNRGIPLSLFRVDGGPYHNLIVDSRVCHLWLQISATHSVMGGLVAVGIAAKGVDSIGWGTLVFAAAGWVCR